MAAHSLKTANTMNREERIQELAERIWRELVIEWGWGEISAWPEAYRRAERAIKE